VIESQHDDDAYDDASCASSQQQLLELEQLMA